MIRIAKYVAAISLSALLWWSCTQERQPCLTPKIASLIMKTVMATAGNIVVDTPMPAAVFIPLTGGSSIGMIYPKTAGFTLSLSSQADTCSWAFATDTAAGSVFDTLTFRYNRQLQFLSNACGYAYFYGLTSVHATHNSIDSILITNTSVTNDVKTSHVQVFIHPKP